MKKILVVLVALAVLAPVSLQAGKYDDVEVRSDGNCSQACVVIGQIYRKKKSAWGSCANKLKKHAKKKYDADAILKYQVGAGSGMYGLDQCKGIAVRWAKPGEDGIMKVTDSTPIAILK